MRFDAAAFREHFPILQRRVNDKPLIYFDNAASAQKPRAVIDAVRTAMEGSYANVHRGLHTLANETTTAYEAARRSVARFLNAPTPETIVFTKGGTEAVNIVAAGLGVEAGDEIVLTEMEHHANIVPWHFLRERKGAVLRWAPFDDDGQIDLDALAGLIGPRTKMVALTHMSNVLGVRTPAAEIIARVHAQNVPVLLDGCQAAAHDVIDVQALDVDFYVITGHKIFGPTGIGALYGKPQRLSALAPFEGGGEMIDRVTRDEITYNDPPHRFEAGTPPILEAIGLGAALDWLMMLDRAAIMAHEEALYRHLAHGLKSINGVRLYGEAPDKGPIAAFNLEGAHPHDVAQILDMQGVAVRAGYHCAQPLMARLGVSATARASLAAYNTIEEIDAFLEALAKARRMLM
jgi:cysteine desulfurase/selenocysteine lyase